MTDRPRGLSGLRQAFDEVQFGPERTLNLRAQRPTASEAVARTEAWLRERQVAKAKEVLLVTGRGNGSVDGVSVVREAVLRLLALLRRRNVIAGYQEHTPGSLIVQLAPVSALLEAPRRRKDPPPPKPDPRSLVGLDPETRAVLRELARTVLASLGVRSPSKKMVEDEMVRQFAALAPNVPEGPEREAVLQQVIARALEEHET